MTKQGLLMSLLLVLGACTQEALQGPPADLAAIAAPDVPKEAPLPPKPPQPIEGPQASAGTFRAWVPGHTSPQGHLTEGHWKLLSTRSPVPDILQPAKPMPRAPRHTPLVRPKEGQEKRATPVQAPQAAPAVVGPSLEEIMRLAPPKAGSPWDMRQGPTPGVAHPVLPMGE